MSLSERMLRYRARNGLTQKKLAELMNESSNMIFRAEKEHSLFEVTKIRLEMKMDNLEAKENENL